MNYALSFLRYIRGYVTLSVVGGFHERFLNLCSSNKITVWDISLEGKTLLCCVYAVQFKKLRQIAKKSGGKLRLISKKGLRFKYRQHSKRAGLIIGMVLFAAIHLILSLFVWCIDIEGNTEISKTEILELAKEHGLFVGTVKTFFDERGAARKIASDFDGRVSWLYINIKGSLAVIELREDDGNGNNIKEAPPCNVVADFDGIILYADTFCGDSTVKPGIAVKKGDLLISGAILNEDMSTTFYPARGKITALRNKKLSKSFNKSIGGTGLSLIDEGIKIGFFGAELNFGVKRKEDNQLLLSSKKSLEVNGYTLPLFIEKARLYTTEKTQESISEGYIYVLEKIQREIYFTNSNSYILSESEIFSVDDNKFDFIGEYNVIDFIGEEKPILSEISK